MQSKALVMFKVEQYLFEFAHRDYGNLIIKLELHRGSKLLFTDYLYLYKIGNDWKIVSKVYHAY